MDLLNTDDDITFVNGELLTVTGQAAIGQDIEMRLKTWLEETPYNTNAGVPYLQFIFKFKNPNLDAVRFVLERVVLDTPGVITANLSVDFNNATRVLVVTGTAQTIEGNVDFSVLVDSTP